MALNLWPVPHGLEDLLNPIGVSGSNPNKVSGGEDARLCVIWFEKRWGEKLFERVFCLQPKKNDTNFNGQSVTNLK